MDVARISAAIMLGIGAIAALHYGESEIAATAIGMLGGWLLKNGIQKAKT